MRERFRRMLTLVRPHRLTAWPAFLPRITQVRPASKRRSPWVGDLSASWRPIRRHAVLRSSAFVCKRFRRIKARTCLPALCNLMAISEKSARRSSEHLAAAIAPATKPPFRQRYLPRILDILFIVDARRFRQAPIPREPDQFLVQENDKVIKVHSPDPT